MTRLPVEALCRASIKAKLVLPSPGTAEVIMTILDGQSPRANVMAARVRRMDSDKAEDESVIMRRETACLSCLARRLEGDFANKVIPSTARPVAASTWPALW